MNPKQFSTDGRSLSAHPEVRKAVPAMVVTQFGFGENEQMPAPNAGGLYKINCHQRLAVL